MTIKDKTIIITGGTSGVGHEMLRLLSTHNRVLVIARPSPRLERIAKTFPQAEVYPADLSSTASYQKVASEILSDFGSIDILINNAAVQFTPTFLEETFEYEAIQREININFTSVCALTYLLLPGLLAAPNSACILNINSGLALAPKTNSAVYCATKAALNSFSQSLAYQLEETNVRVLQSFLPLVDTPMTKGRDGEKMTPQKAAQEILSGLAQGAPITDVGKVRLLRLLLAIAPWLARKIMKNK